MKHLILSISCCFSLLLLSASIKVENRVLQDTTEIKYSFIAVGYTKGGELQKDITCLQNGTKITMRIKHSDTLYIDKTIEKPNIFNIVDSNLNDLKEAAKSQVKYRNAKTFIAQYNDTSLVTLQIAIRYKDLHFNHFQLLTDEELRNIKNKKVVNGFRVVKRLFEILSLAEKQ